MACIDAPWFRKAGLQSCVVKTLGNSPVVWSSQIQVCTSCKLVVASGVLQVNFTAMILENAGELHKESVP